MIKIDLKKIDRQSGIDPHEHLRDGRSPDLDPIKVAAIINALVDQVNNFAEEIESMKTEIFRTQKSNRTIKRKIKRIAE